MVGDIKEEGILTTSTYIRLIPLSLAEGNYCTIIYHQQSRWRSLKRQQHPELTTHTRLLLLGTINRIWNSNKNVHHLLRKHLKVTTFRRN